MKATNSIRQPLLFGNLIIFLVTFLSFSFNSLVAKNNAKLSQVFTSEASPNDKQVLKLYDDNSYEFLHFVIVLKKPKVIREQGSYILESKKLKLKSRNKKGVIDHPKHYFFLSEKGLFKSRAHAKKVNAAPALATNKDSKYYEAFYIDSIFGKVSNDQKVFNKLADPKLKVKPKVVEPVEIITSEPMEIVEPIVETKNEEVSESEINKFKQGLKIKLPTKTLRMIKAVIVVGNDGNEFINEEMNVAFFLKELGVNVVELYTPDCKWEDVKKASKGAHIFIYAGHGGTRGAEKQGTLYLNEGVIEGPDLVEGLKLHKNAFVFFNHACESAGSSARDRWDIGIAEATKRVEDYAKPFVKLNVGCYYANNYYNYIFPVLVRFFRGEKIKDIYTYDASKSTTIETSKTCGYNKKYEISVSSSNFKSKTYDIAYVGIPTFTVYDFFK
jgi:hypothetical protein